MFYKANLFFIFFCCASISFSQNFTISNEIKLDNGDNYSVMGKYTDRYLFMTINNNSNVKVQSFNENLIWLNTKELKLESKKISVIDNLVGKKNFFLFYTLKQKQKIYIKASKFDSKCNILDSTTFMISEIKNFTPKVEIKFSDDKSKTLVYFFEEKNVFHGCIFENDSFKKLQEVNFTLKSFDDETESLDVIISNNAEIFLIDQNLLERDSKRETSVFKYKNELLKILKVKIPARKISSTKVLYDNINEKLIVCGLQNSKDNYKPNNVYAMIVNSALDTFSFSVDFTQELISLANGKLNSKKSGIEDLVIENVILRKDGGFLVVAEQQKSIERLNNSFRSGIHTDMPSSFFDYYYDNMVFVSFSPSGKCDWQNTFFKKQVSHNDGAAFSSYFLHKRNDALRFIFNDEIENETTISEYNVMPNGRLQRNSVFSTMGKKLLLRFRTGIQINANESVIVSESRNKLHLVRIVF